MLSCVQYIHLNLYANCNLCDPKRINCVGVILKLEFHTYNKILPVFVYRLTNLA